MAHKRFLASSEEEKDKIASTQKQNFTPEYFEQEKENVQKFTQVLYLLALF